MRSLGLRDGDHVALARGIEAGAGGADDLADDLAAVVGPDGTSALWSVRREGTRLRCGRGDRASEQLTERHARVSGVVVAILRRDP